MPNARANLLLDIVPCLPYIRSGLVLRSYSRSMMHGLRVRHIHV